MGVLSDRQIAALGEAHISPIVLDAQRNPGRISHGVSSYGYDVRLAPRLRVTREPSRAFTGGMIDPKSPSLTAQCFDEEIVPSRDIKTGDEFFVLPPHGFALGESLEIVRVPRDLMVICFNKSTYARCGIIVNVTPLEPEWEGTITLELSNTTPHPARVYANEGIAQLVFLRADQVCGVSYADKRGKYQNQRGITLPKVP